MIFQQPQSSLNPVLTVGDQIAEVLHIHQDVSKEDAWAKSVEMLRLVGIPSPEKKVHAYPHEMSGGQAQRVMIAMALILNPMSGSCHQKTANTVAFTLDLELGFPRAA